MLARVQAVYSGLLTYDTLGGRILGRNPNFQYPRAGGWPKRWCGRRMSPTSNKSVLDTKLALGVVQTAKASRMKAYSKAISLSRS